MLETVLVMDHNLARRQSLYELLTDVNYRVTTVPNAQELVDCLKRDRPHCVLVATGESPDDATLTLRHLRDVDQQLKVVLLVPPVQVETLGVSHQADGRLTILNAAMDQRDLIRSLLGVLKEREVEKIEGSSGMLRGNVLVIEDEVRVAQMLTEYLQRRGYHVTAITNGEEALLQLTLVKPRIVILDILLPGMDGLLALKQIKAKAPGVSVIVSSGFEDPELMTQAEALGACAYLVKPFNLAKLEAAILASTLPS